jgi:hypothetical protein
VPKAAAPADVSSATVLQQHVGQALADVKLLENTERRAGVIARLVLAGLRVLEVGSMEARLEALEQRLGRDQ